MGFFTFWHINIVLMVGAYIKHGQKFQELGQSIYK